MFARQWEYLTQTFVSFQHLEGFQKSLQEAFHSQVENVSSMGQWVQGNLDQCYLQLGEVKAQVLDVEQGLDQAPQFPPVDETLAPRVQKVESDLKEMGTKLDNWYAQVEARASGQGSFARTLDAKLSELSKNVDHETEKTSPG